jgi:hypothetical protein
MSEFQYIFQNFPLGFNFMKHFSMFPMSDPNGKTFPLSLAYLTSFHHMELCPDLSWGLSPIARPALKVSTNWISNWPLLGVPRDWRMQGPFNVKFQTQELINMACQHCTSTECLEEERTFLVPPYYKESMCLFFYYKESVSFICSLCFLSLIFLSFHTLLFATH